MLEIANCFRDPGLRPPAPYHTRLHAIPNRKSQSFVDSVFAGVFNATVGFRILTGYANPGPTVNWYEIQPKLAEDLKAKSDILTLLDCHHAAQAGRGQDSVPEQKWCRLFATWAMGVGTPEPGKCSFTMCMVPEIGRMLEESGEAIITHLHGQLRKKGVLQQTPVHVDFTR